MKAKRIKCVKVPSTVHYFDLDTLEFYTGDRGKDNYE